jgi:hypothetical protein
MYMLQLKCRIMLFYEIIKYKIIHENHTSTSYFIE